MPTFWFESLLAITTLSAVFGNPVSGNPTTDSLPDLEAPNCGGCEASSGVVFFASTLCADPFWFSAPVAADGDCQLFEDCAPFSNCDFNYVLEFRTPPSVPTCCGRVSISRVSERFDLCDDVPREISSSATSFDSAEGDKAAFTEFFDLNCCAARTDTFQSSGQVGAGCSNPQTSVIVSFQCNDCEGDE